METVTYFSQQNITRIVKKRVRMTLPTPMFIELLTVFYIAYVKIISLDMIPLTVMGNLPVLN